MYRFSIKFVTTTFNHLEHKGFYNILRKVTGVRYFTSNRVSNSLLQSRQTLYCYGFHQSYSNKQVQSVNIHESITKLDPRKPTSNNENEDESVGNIGLQEDSSDLFDNIDYDEITGGDIDNINKFKLLLLEVDVLRQDGMRVPKKISTNHWKELLSLQTRSQRRKLLQFLWKTEMKKLGDIRRKEIKKLQTQERLKKLDEEMEKNNHIHYGFQGVTIFLRIYETARNHFHNARLVQAMQLGENLVVDCGYDSDMTVMENKLCAKQLSIMFADNRVHKDPLNIHFCNMNRNSVMFRELHKLIPTIDCPDFPINISTEHYLNLFPKEKLVYLTPHCRTELKEFNADDIYIIGAFVDKCNSQPLSLAKAKSEGIRMAQLPLDRYLDWGQGTKSLTINQVVKILLDLHLTGDWNLALKNVPTRKVRQPGEPVQDLRKLQNRGTFLQPPRFQKYKKYY